MLIQIVEDNKNLGKAYQKYLGRICGHRVKLNYKYEDLIPDKLINAYILDHDIDGGMNGSKWIKQYGDNIPVHKRILSSGGDGWERNKVSGIYLPKPVNVKDLEETLDLIHENNMRLGI